MDVVLQQWPAVVDAYRKCASSDSYLHFDELQQGPAPVGLGHEVHWAALKLARSAGLKAIPLTDRDRRSFEFNFPYRLTELLHRIDRSKDHAAGAPGEADRLLASMWRKEAVGSAVLAGATSLQEAAEEMLRCDRQPKDRSERMIFNLHRALEMVQRLCAAALSPAMVFDLHRCIVEDTLTLADAAGRFRREGEIVALHGRESSEQAPPPAPELEHRLESMCAFANGETPGFFIHPVLRAILLHFWLSYDHPFVDGNGRTARMLFRWAMLRQGYPLFAFVAISPVLLQDPDRYALAFRHTETDDNDLTYFLLHQADVIGASMTAFHEHAARVASEIDSTEAGLPGFAALNLRQQALIAHALRHPGTRYVIAGHQRSHGVTHQTARDDLFDLTRRELLTVGKQGRAYFFQATTDLPRALRSAVGRPRSVPLFMSGELPTSLL